MTSQRTPLCGAANRNLNGMDSATVINGLAEELMRAIEAGDMGALRHIYAADAVIWHATDRIDRPVEANIAFLSEMSKLFPTVRYEEIRRHTYPGGYAQQHRLRVVRTDGEEFTFPACFIVRVAGGKITRIDEYFDSKQLPVPVSAPT